MYSGLTEALGGVLVIWLLVLSYIVYKERNYLRELFPKEEGRDIRNKFSEVLRELENLGKQNLTLNRNIRELARTGLRHVQRVKVIRYNPYGDTGGNVSFSIALLDGRGTGLIITSLHTRSGTRVYTKEIKEGESELQLSKEESEVMKQALND